MFDILRCMEIDIEAYRDRATLADKVLSRMSAAAIEWAATPDVASRLDIAANLLGIVEMLSQHDGLPLEDLSIIKRAKGQEEEFSGVHSQQCS